MGKSFKTRHPLVEAIDLHASRSSPAAVGITVYPSLAIKSVHRSTLVNFASKSSAFGQRILAKASSFLTIGWSLQVTYPKVGAINKSKIINR